ncbi:Uncharacterised protein [BD1-7 clade bacterium]|uniref:Uncharacterized protein n=1 Tax=BD1-7 clade bacterium TaxID=2029982 RepID=A0A5S9PJA4_9GAMM|nr:Uncharacterised protein [BD1-7 clade bacterium]
MAGGARKAGASELAFKMNAAVEGGGKVVRGRASYNGLTIYYMVYSEFAVQKSNTNEKNKEEINQNKNMSTFGDEVDDDNEAEDAKVDTKSYKELWNIIGEKNFPKLASDSLNILSL